MKIKTLSRHGKQKMTKNMPRPQASVSRWLSKEARWANLDGVSLIRVVASFRPRCFYGLSFDLREHRSGLDPARPWPNRGWAVVQRSARWKGAAEATLILMRVRWPGSSQVGSLWSINSKKCGCDRWSKPLPAQRCRSATEKIFFRMFSV